MNNNRLKMIVSLLWIVAMLTACGSTDESAKIQIVEEDSQTTEDSTITTQEALSDMKTTDEALVKKNDDDNEKNKEYLLPESDKRFLSREELFSFNAEMCILARNEIYARHGRLFNDAEIQSYFVKKSWYKGTIKPEDFDDNVLNQYEKDNIKTILDYEVEMGYRTDDKSKDGTSTDYNSMNNELYEFFGTKARYTVNSMMTNYIIFEKNEEDPSEKIAYNIVFYVDNRLNDGGSYSFDAHPISYENGVLRCVMYGSEMPATNNEATFDISMTIVDHGGMNPATDGRNISITVKGSMFDDEYYCWKSIEYGNDSKTYMLYDSDTRYISEDELYGFDANMCMYARNEIYARHGRIFDDAGLNAFFSAKSWYKGTIAAEDFDDSVLNDYEKTNIETILNYERSKGYR